MLAIHHSKYSFSDRWIDHCESNNIEYKIVNCYSNDIINHLNECDALVWHFSHYQVKDYLMAKQLIFALDHDDFRIFPDFHTSWHFDDKIGQKYLFEKMNIPHIPSYVFYSKKDALSWVEKADFPKVFKLRGGAGASNVRLVRTKNGAKKVINKAFGRGFSQYNRINRLKETIRKRNLSISYVKNFIESLGRVLISTEFARVKGAEKAYVYFQDFISNNDSDIRIIVISNKAFAIKRLVRKGDFRASGSGKILYDPGNISIETLRLAFRTADLLKTQCAAFDFIYDKGKPLLVEVSYGFTAQGYDLCPGYWDDNLIYHSGSFNPYGWMINNLLND